MVRYLLLLLFPVLLLSNCNKDNEQVLFEIPYQLNFTVQAGLNTLETHYYEVYNIPSRIDSLLITRGLTKEDISVISPKSAELSSQFADGDYGFLREVSVEIFETGSNYFKEVYFHPQVPQNTRSILNLAGTLVDASDFVTADKFNIRVGLRLRNISPQVIESRLKFTFAVK